MILRILILIGLVKLLDETESPLTCAIVYIIISLILGLLYSVSVTGLLVTAILGGAFAFLYFWLLQKYKYTGLLWWAILIIGALIGFI